MNKKQLFEIIFFIVLITIMVMSLNLAILDSTGMTIKLITLLEYTFLAVVLAAILLRYRIALAGAGVVAVAGGIFAYAKHIMIPSKVIAYLVDFFIWLPQFVIGYAPFDVRFSLIFAVLYIIFVTLVISLLVFSRKGYGLLIVLGVAAFAFFWFIYVEKARQYMFYYLFAALILYSYNVFDRRRLEWVKSESSIDRNIEIKWIFNSLLIVLLSTAIAQFAVIDLKPVHWNWLNEKAIQMFPFIESWRNDNLDPSGFGFSSRYDISRVGYDTARLGGPVKLSESLMLTLETNSTDSLYLKGRVKDFYTGSSWHKTKKEFYEYKPDMEVALPFASDIKTYKTDIRITHQKLLTSSIFYPNMLSSVNTGLKKYFIDADTEAYFPRIVTKREPYTVTSEMPFIDVRKLKNIDAASQVPDIYMQLPDNIPTRVRDLSLSITRKYRNDYDKAKALESYLRENYKYTLAPAEVPNDAEFVDYFLFQGKEGYCTYFATALAVMMRESGIPCRYVEGFLSEGTNSYVRNIPGTNAHAWVEVNFGPYGWIVFEATPAYPLQGFRTQREVPTAPTPDPTQSAPTTPNVPLPNTDRDKNLQIEDEGANANQTQNKEISLTARIILALFAILLIRILYLLLKKAYIELRIKEASGKRYAVKYFEDILRHLKKLGIKMEKEETMREFWFKVKYTLESEYKNGDEVIALLEQARYGAAAITEQQRKQLEDYRKMLKKYVTARLGTIKFLISYYIIGL